MQKLRKFLFLLALPAAAQTAAPAKPAADDLKLVQGLQRRIASGTKEKKASDMKPYKSTIPGTDVSFEMVPIPGGEFTMGTPTGEAGRQKDEGPQHKVKLDPFWMAAHEVTWDEYRLFQFAQADGKMPDVDAVSHPTRPYVEMSFGMGLNGFPAISMTQHAANKYAQWLSAKTGQFYRLPTEAEWEYACRADNAPVDLAASAWYDANANGKYQLVGKKKPNAWGLYDMLGNVMEWTLDAYAPYSAAEAVNPWVKSKTSYPQVARGGSWNDPASSLRCGARVASDASWKQQDPQLPKSIWYLTDAQWLGFRLVRPLKVPSVVEMNSYWNNGVEVDP
ncbi:MAG: formylglycine-generating enzyme family protein [Acidobacteria bacterium]|nr:formylglycine-generating enzyme family protein [Acidobacteriota bacterium]